MMTNVTEKDLLTDFESISEEMKKSSAADPYLKEYQQEAEGLNDRKPFVVVPATFSYIISSC